MQTFVRSYLRILVAALYLATAVLWSISTGDRYVWLLLVSPALFMIPLFWVMLPMSGLKFDPFAMPFAGLLFAVDPTIARRLPVKLRLPLFLAPTYGVSFGSLFAMALYAATGNPFFTKAALVFAAAAFGNLIPIPDMTLGGHFIRTCFPEMKPAMKFVLTAFVGAPLLAFTAWAMASVGLFPLIFLGAFFTPFNAQLSDEHSETASQREIMQHLGLLAFMLFCWGGVMLTIAMSWQ